MAEEKEKRVRNDEETLARVLEAAYIVQQHNRESQETKLGPKLQQQPDKADRSSLSSSEHVPAAEKTDSAEDYDSILAKVVEAQFEFQSKHLGSQQVMQLVAARLPQIARAAGAGVALLENNQMCYRAAAGPIAPAAGSQVPIGKALCSGCLHDGQIIRCTDTGVESFPDSSEYRRRGIHSAVAVPIFRNGGIAGGLELYYSTEHAFHESDVHSCQLMAGLITEALTREAELHSTQLAVKEEAVIVERTEKQARVSPAVGGSASQEPAKTKTPPAGESISTCVNCGHELIGEEQFCAKCGSPRGTKPEPSTLQSKVAALWHMQEARHKSTASVFPSHHLTQDEVQTGPNAIRSNTREAVETEDWKHSTPEKISNASANSETETTHSTGTVTGLNVTPTGTEQEDQEHEDESESTTLETSEQLPDWSSAANARDYLEQLAEEKTAGRILRFWNTRRGDIYLILAVILTAFVIRWEMSSNRSSAINPSPGSAQHQSGPEAGLPLFDRILISLGLAEAPEPQDYKGNPNVPVWVDLRTALYYCPGTDLYGKTEKGKFTSQRDAQLDRFEPAYRKACD